MLLTVSLILFPPEVCCTVSVSPQNKIQTFRFKNWRLKQLCLPAFCECESSNGLFHLSVATLRFYFSSSSLFSDFPSSLLPHLPLCLMTRQKLSSSHRLIYSGNWGTPCSLYQEYCALDGEVNLPRKSWGQKREHQLLLEQEKKKGYAIYC